MALGGFGGIGKEFLESGCRAIAAIAGGGGGGGGVVPKDGRGGGTDGAETGGGGGGGSSGEFSEVFELTEAVDEERKWFSFRGLVGGTLGTFKV